MRGPTHSDLAAGLRARGLRVTSQRRLVLDALAGADDHLSAEEIHSTARAADPSINMSTVYRTLEALEEAGLVYHSHLGHSMSQWHIATPTDIQQHLVCEACGHVQHVALDTFLPYQTALAREFGFHADPRHFAVFGRCRECQAIRGA